MTDVLRTRINWTDPQFGSWLGYRDGRLVAIELSGFHGGESFQSWAARFDYALLVDEEEAIQRWDDEVRGVAA